MKLNYFIARKMMLRRQQIPVLTILFATLLLVQESAGQVGVSSSSGGGGNGRYARPGQRGVPETESSRVMDSRVMVDDFHVGKMARRRRNLQSTQEEDPPSDWQNEPVLGSNEPAGSEFLDENDGEYQDGDYYETLRNEDEEDATEPTGSDPSTVPEIQSTKPAAQKNDETVSTPAESTPAASPEDATPSSPIGTEAVTSAPTPASIDNVATPSPSEMSNPETASPTEQIVATPSPTPLATKTVTVKPTSSPYEPYPPIPHGDNNGFDNEPTLPYNPPDDDPIQNDDFQDENESSKTMSLQDLEKQAEDILRDRNVKIASSVLGVVGFILLVLTAQQMIENPDGCCAKICRCTVATIRILCFPITCCLCPRKKRAHHHDYSIANRDYDYGSDLELT